MSRTPRAYSVFSYSVKNVPHLPNRCVQKTKKNACKKTPVFRPAQHFPRERRRENGHLENTMSRQEKIAISPHEYCRCYLLPSSPSLATTVSRATQTDAAFTARFFGALPPSAKNSCARSGNPRQPRDIKKKKVHESFSSLLFLVVLVIPLLPVPVTVLLSPASVPDSNRKCGRGKN